MVYGKLKIPLSPKLIFKKKLGFLQQPHIVIYRGFGNMHEVHVKGRVLEEKAMSKPQKSQTKWQNLKEMAQRYFSGYFADVAVTVTCQNKQQEVITQADGLFETVFQFEEALPEGWLAVEAKLNAYPNVSCQGEAMIASADGGMAVISDVDDTVLISHSTEAFKAIRLLLFRNARSRMPFAGVGALYKALCKGNGELPNPIFYVSSSEWNLYDLLVDFFNFNNIAKGTFLLHDYRTSIANLTGRSHERHNHKLDKIETLLNTYPHRQFIFIGDSGQRDAEIYGEVVERHPDRIKAVFIRNVSTPLRAGEIKKLYKQLRHGHTRMYLVDDTLQAADAALKQGLITLDDFNAIAKAMKREQMAPSSLLEGAIQMSKST